MDNANNPAPKRHRKLNKKRITLTLLSLLIVLATVGFGIWSLAHHDSSPIPKNVRQTASFPLYYPETVPSGYYLDKSSVKSSRGLIYYTFKSSSGGASITVSSQATPKDFDASKLIGGAPIPSTVIPVGNLYNLSIGQHTEYMITTSNGALMFISAPGKVSGPLIYSLANSLKPI